MEGSLVSITVEKLIEQNNLSHGQKALDQAGMPNEFAAHTLQWCHDLGLSVSFRVGNPPNADIPYAPKPCAIHSKTSNHGLVKGFIPVNPTLNKIDIDKNRVLPHDPHDAKQEGIPLKLSLRTILEQCKPEGDMQITDFDPDTGQLHLKYKDGFNPPAGFFSGEFVLNVNAQSAQKRRITRSSIALQAHAPLELSPSFFTTLIHFFRGIATPESKLQDYLKNKDDTFLEHIVPIQVQEHPDVPPEPLRVFANTVLNKETGQPELLPVTGDWDLFTIGSPRTPTIISPDCNTVYNSFKNQNTLQAACELYFISLQQAAQNTPEEQRTPIQKSLAEHKLSIDDIFPEVDIAHKIEDPVARAGCITPAEFVNTRILNLLYAQKDSPLLATEQIRGLSDDFDPNANNLLQHGPENRNPGDPSPVDGKMLHFYQGQMFMTENLEQLVQFYAMTHYLEDHTLAVHPKWDQQAWAPIVQKQQLLALQQPVSDNISVSPVLLSQQNLPLYKEMVEEKQPLHEHTPHLYTPNRS
jgi:hypothetical protein